MSTRTIVLLIIMGGLWGGVFFFFFYQPTLKKGATVASFMSKTMLNKLVKIKIPSDIMEEWEMLVNEKISEIELFEPAKINFDVNFADESILFGAPTLQEYKFLGFIKSENDLVVFLKSKSKIEEKHLNELIDGRYLVIHISSLGVLTVDLQKGGFYAIRP